MSAGKTHTHIFVSHTYARSASLAAAKGKSDSAPDLTVEDTKSGIVYRFQGKYLKADLGDARYQTMNPADLADALKRLESSRAAHEAAEASSRMLKVLELESASPAGERAIGLLRFLYTAKTFDAIFAQTIADFRLEIAQAEAAGEIRKGKWRRVQLVLALADTAFCHGLNWLLERVEKVRKLTGS